MFKTVACLFFILICGGAAVAIFPIRESDKRLYQELLKSSTADKDEIALTYSQQKREGVCKQIWYQDDSPLYFRIESAESELFFFRQQNQLEVIEQLGKVKCLMQEDLFYEEERPMQKVRYLEAERASYNYNTQLFIAEEVKLWQYKLEGHTPPAMIEDTKPLMNATAHSVEFTLKGEKLDFTAHQMRAELNSREGIL